MSNLIDKIGNIGYKKTVRIEELTIRDIKLICKKHKRCHKCPLENHTWCCMGLKNMTEKELKSDVEYKI